jgi:hypothetical protein
MSGKIKTYVIRDHRFLENLIEFLRKLPLDKRPWQVEIEPYVKRRSKRQNALYWSWLEILAGEFGYTKDELHIVLGEQLLPKVELVNRFTGEALMVPKSTTQLSTVEFRDYLDHIERIAAEHGIMLPQPNDHDAWDAASPPRRGDDHEDQSGTDAVAHQHSQGEGRRGGGADCSGPEDHRRPADRAA